MKVVMSIGNGRLHLMNSAKYIAQRGVELRLICGFVPKKADSLLIKIASFLARRDVSAGMRCRMLSLPFLTIHTCGLSEIIFLLVRTISQRIGVSTHFADFWGWWLFGWASKRYINNADIFHCRSGAGQGGAIMKAKREGMRVLVDHSALHPAVSGNRLREEYARWHIPVAIDKDVGVWRHVLRDCGMADLIMVNSQHIKDSFVAQGFSAEKICVVYLGVRSDFNAIRMSRPWRTEFSRTNPMKVLFTGGFSLLKGAEYFLESLRILISQGENVEYHVVGTIDIPGKLQSKYNHLPIVYHGPVPQDGLMEFLKSSDAYLFPSLADGCAQSGMEAMSAGLPVVTTLGSGLPIKDGETGLIVPMKDALAIVTKIKYLIHNPSKMRELGEAASLQIRDSFSWEHYGERVEKIYESMMKSARS